MSYTSPPGKSAEELKDLIQYIVDTADHVCSNHPDCGVAIMGDFNRLNISDILLHHDFKQVVESPTRSTVLLDLIITDFNIFYNKPETTAPLGSSDHNVITWNPVMDPVMDPGRPWTLLVDGLVTIRGLVVWTATSQLTE